MTTNANSVLLAQASIGKDAEDFLKSELGRTIIGLARIETRLAMDQLKTAVPTNPEAIRDLQNKIWLSERFEGWLTELMMRGRQALQQLDVRMSDQFDGAEIDGEAQSGRPDSLGTE